MGIYFEKGNNYNIRDEDLVKVINFKNADTVQVKNTKKLQNNLKSYKKLNKHEYVDLNTGEIKKYIHNAGKSTSGINRALKNLTSLIRNNFTGADNELFITLTTTAETGNIEDINKMFKIMWYKLKEKYKGLEYIYVVELQNDRNSWHIHALLKDLYNEKLYIKHTELVQLWKKGFVKVNRIRNIYRTAEYVAKIKTKENVQINKRLYYASRGIKKPKAEVMTYSEFKNTYGKNKYRAKENTVLVRSIRNDNIINKHKTETWKRSYTFKKR